MAFLSQATSSWRLASSSRLPFRSMLLTPRGGPWCLAPRAHQIPVYLMVFSTFLCRAFTAHYLHTPRSCDIPTVSFHGAHNPYNSVSSQRVPAGLLVSKIPYPDADQRHRPRPCLCGDRWHARASVGCLCSRQTTTSHPSPLRPPAPCPRQPRPDSAWTAKRCLPTPAPF